MTRIPFQVIDDARKQSGSAQAGPVLGINDPTRREDPWVYIANESITAGSFVSIVATNTRRVQLASAVLGRGICVGIATETQTEIGKPIRVLKNGAYPTANVATDATALAGWWVVLDGVSAGRGLAIDQEFGPASIRHAGDIMAILLEPPAANVASVWVKAPY
jgi:hypothetical protein